MAPVTISSYYYYFFYSRWLLKETTSFNWGPSESILKLPSALHARKNRSRRDAHCCSLKSHWELVWFTALPQAEANCGQSFEIIIFINSLCVRGVMVAVEGQCVCLHASLFQQRKSVLPCPWWRVFGSMVSTRSPGCVRGKLQERVHAGGLVTYSKLSCSI